MCLFCQNFIPFVENSVDPDCLALRKQVEQELYRFSSTALIAWFRNNKISIMIEIENWQKIKTISYFLCVDLPVSFACGE